MERVAQNVGYFCNFPKADHSKPSPNMRKFARPCHPEPNLGTSTYIAEGTLHNHKTKARFCILRTISIMYLHAYYTSKLANKTIKPI
jgi:hypothetical protein